MTYRWIRANISDKVELSLKEYRKYFRLRLTVTWKIYFDKEDSTVCVFQKHNHLFAGKGLGPPKASYRKKAFHFVFLLKLKQKPCIILEKSILLLSIWNSHSFRGPSNSKERPQPFSLSLALWKTAILQRYLTMSQNSAAEISQRTESSNMLWPIIHSIVLIFY